MTAPNTTEFVAEVKEYLADICDHLLRLEGASAEPSSDHITALLRSAHSIKGGAAFFGFRAVEQVAHAMESALEAYLHATRPVDHAAVDALLAATDKIAALVDDLDHAQNAAVGEMLNRLHALANQNEPPEGPSEPCVVEHTFSIAIDLSACQQSGRPPIDVIQSAMNLGQLSDGHLEFPKVDWPRDSLRGPVIWHATIQSALTRDEFEQAMAIPCRHAVIPASTTSDAAPAVAAAPEPEASPAAARSPVPERVRSIRIPVSLADQLINLAGELVLVRNQTRRFSEANEPLPASLVQRFDSVTGDFQAAVLQTRMQPVRNLFSRFPRLVRDLGRQLGKQIELVISGAEVELDKAILDAITDPLTHIIRNACDHGLEAAEARRAQGKSERGKITLTARHDGDQISISVSDDGRGIDRDAVRQTAVRRGLRQPHELAQMDDSDLLSLILLPGFSTAAEVTDLSGRGVGMDVVRTNLAQLSGTVQVESEAGKGTTIVLRLPLTLAIIPSILVSALGQVFAIPQKDVEELIEIDERNPRARVEASVHQEFVRLRGKLLPLLRLASLLANTPEGRADGAAEPARRKANCLVAVAKAGGRRFAVEIDAIVSTEEIVVQPMHSRLRGLKHYSGATILGDGTVALILSTEGLAAVGKVSFGSDSEIRPKRDHVLPADSENLLLLRQLNGDRVAVPIRTVQRIVMVHRGHTEIVGGDPYYSVEGKPTRLQALGQPWGAPWFSGCAFAVLPRAADRLVGCVVSEVLGIESVSLEQILPLVSMPTALGMVDLQGSMTPIVDLREACSDCCPTPLESPPESARQARRVLLVDDTRFFRELVGNQLRDAGFEVTTAADGAEALAALHEGPFDLVVSDLEMPVLNGLELAQAIRKVDAWQTLPVLALTTLASDEIREQAIQHGFDDLEVKLTASSFLASVYRLLQGRPTESRSGEVRHA